MTSMVESCSVKLCHINLLLRPAPSLTTAVSADPNTTSATWDKISYCMINKDLC